MQIFNRFFIVMIVLGVGNFSLSPLSAHEHTAVEAVENEVPDVLELAGSEDETASDKELKSLYLGFVYPLGIDFTDSIKYQYEFSLSSLGSVTGGTAGVAISGLFNFSLGNSYGLKIAGIANVTVGKLDGISVGLLNIITEDSPDAVPIGLLSIVAGGRYQLGIALSTLLPSGALVYRMGARNFYTIYSVAPYVSYDNFSYQGLVAGLGLGADIPFNENFRLLVELETFNMNSLSDSKFIRNVVQLRALASFEILEKAHFLFGPTFNTYLNLGDDKDKKFEPLWGVSVSDSLAFGAGLYLGLAYTF